MNLGIYECPYCYKKFTSEPRFKKHTCDEKQKFELLHSRRGRAAFAAYKEWFRLKKRTVPSEETFLKSRYFTMFVEFQIWAGKVSLADRMGYIKYAVSKNLLPNFWRMPEVYEGYMAEFDDLYPPDKQAEITGSTLNDIAGIIGCRMDEIFDYLHAAEVVKFIQCRKLSPWVLLVSKSFLNFLNHKVTTEERILLNSVINSHMWRDRFRQNPDAVDRMRKLVTDLSL